MTTSKKRPKAVQEIIDWLLAMSAKDQSVWVHPRNVAEQIKRGEYKTAMRPR